MSNQKRDSGPTQEEKRPPEEASARRADATAYYYKLEKASRARDKDRTAKELHLALETLKEAGLKVSVVAVAEAVGVHPSLVHHVYPELAQEISDLRRGAGPTKKEREESSLAKALRDLADLRAKFREAEKSVETLVSRNATLDARIRSLEEKQAGGTSKVLPLKVKARDKTV